MARKSKPFEIDTAPTKEVVVNSLTKDATVEACIFDLIDNAVDAARDTIFRSLGKKGQTDLPESYTGFEIRVAISGAGFRIEDNCGGIPINDLRSGVMRFGRLSSKQMGIGVYGVGLNRALFKLGKVSHLKTDTGSDRAELILKNDEYLKSDDWNLPAEAFQSRGKIGTEIEIRQLPSEIAQSFADEQWVAALCSEVGHRYGRFIDKKLTIFINDLQIENLEPQIREDGPYDPRDKFYKTEDGVAIRVQYGQHQNHRFKNEPDYDAERNKTIPAETGWTILCNDRAVLVSDRSYKTGWDAKFHTEFYGFVGSVSFIGEPKKLPWNTTKIDVDMNNPAYQMALEDMRRFVEEWRSFGETRKKKAAKGEKLNPLPPKPQQTAPAPSISASPPKPTAPRPPAGKASKPVAKIDHNEFRTVLPDDINAVHCFDKHLALVNEAKLLDLVEFPYSGLALIRMLFETSCVTHFDRHGKSDELKQFAIAARRKRGMKIDAEAERKAQPTVDEILSYLDKNLNVLGSKGTYLRHVITKMSAHQKTMNTVLHNPWQMTNRTQAIVVRDESLPLLRHLIEN